MRHSINELSMETNRLSQLLKSTEHEKTALKQSFIELSVMHKSDEKIIAELKHNLDKVIGKNKKIEFQNRSLRLKLRDALSFKELYFKLKNKTIADKKHFENSLNDLKTTHWNTLKELSQYKDKDLLIEPLQTELSQYQQKLEKLEDNLSSQQNKNNMIQNNLSKIEKDYFKAKQIDDLQNDNHKLMTANKKLLQDCMKYESIFRADNIKRRSFIGINNARITDTDNTPSTTKTHLQNRKNSVSTANEMLISTNDVLNESNLIELDFDDPTLIRCNYVYHWNVDHVIEWLQHHLPNKLKHYIDNFRNHAIDGNKLMSLDSITLKLIGIDASDNIRRVLQCIHRLQQTPIQIQRITQVDRATIDTRHQCTQTLPDQSLTEMPSKQTPDIINDDENSAREIHDTVSPTQSLTFTDTYSIAQSSQYSTSFVNTDTDTLRMELKTMKRTKNKLIVSVKMLTKQLKICKANDEMANITRSKSKLIKTKNY